MSKPGAIGYVRKDVSGIQQQWDEERIRSLAERLGYNLLKTVAFSERTPDPLGQLIAIAGSPDVDAVFVPNDGHLGGKVPRSLVAVADVVLVFSEETHARWAAIH